MTNKQKRIIDEAVSVIDKEIRETLAIGTCALIGAIVDNGEDDNREMADYYFSEVVKVLNDFVELTKKAWKIGDNKNEDKNNHWWKYHIW